MRRKKVLVRRFFFLLGSPPERSRSFLAHTHTHTDTRLFWYGTMWRKRQEEELRIVWNWTLEKERERHTKGNYYLGPLVPLLLSLTSPEKSISLGRLITSRDTVVQLEKWEWLNYLSFQANLRCVWSWMTSACIRPSTTPWATSSSARNRPRLMPRY